MMLTSSGATVVLHATRPGEEPRIVPGIQVDDINQAYATFKAKGATLIDTAPRPVPAGMAFSLRDGAGNELNILEFR